MWGCMYEYFGYATKKIVTKKQYRFRFTKKNLEISKNWRENNFTGVS
jgi:hypothetical protein